MLPKYIKCPWCHSPMKLYEIVCEDAVIRRGEEQLRDYYYECDVCGSRSPEVYLECSHEWAEERLAILCRLPAETKF